MLREFTSSMLLCHWPYINAVMFALTSCRCPASIPLLFSFLHCHCYGPGFCFRVITLVISIHCILLKVILWTSLSVFIHLYWMSSLYNHLLYYRSNAIKYHMTAPRPHILSTSLRQTTITPDLIQPTLSSQLSN